jgi:enoyl-[acyl-carrier-protein] reductase (NADH)
MGIANQHSIASGIARFLVDEGADIAFSFLPDECWDMGCCKKVIAGSLYLFITNQHLPQRYQ